MVSLLFFFFPSAISALLFLFLFSTNGFPSPPLSTSPAPQYLSFLCIFFHFFIEVVTSVNFFSPAYIFVDPCISCSLPLLYPSWLATVDVHFQLPSVQLSLSNVFPSRYWWCFTNSDQLMKYSWIHTVVVSHHHCRHYWHTSV